MSVLLRRIDREHGADAERQGVRKKAEPSSRASPRAPTANEQLWPNKRGLIRPCKGIRSLTIPWRLNAAKAQPI
jgi:hypothetical protein